MRARWEPSCQLECDAEIVGAWPSFCVHSGVGSSAVSTISGGPSPSRMAGTGWDKDTLKPGDQITAIGHRISDGTYFLRLIKVVAPDGRELICYGDR